MVLDIQELYGYGPDKRIGAQNQVVRSLNSGS
jgi:hypothetical protein